MPTFYSPEGNPEVWAKKPAGYSTPEEWAAAHPAPEPAPGASLAAELAAVDDDLARLDAEYLTPRVLANLAQGDEFARAEYKRHEALAEPLRRRRAELTLLTKEAPDAEN